MRLALVTQEYPPETGFGGIGTQARTKAEELAARGHQVHVLSASADGTRRSRASDGVTVTRIATADRRLALHTEPARALAWSVEVAAALAALHAQTPFDLVEFPEWGGEAYLHLLNRVPWSRVPTVVQVHGPIGMLAETLGWPERDSEHFRILDEMERTCLCLADAVYASSACLRDWCQRLHGLDRALVPVLHSGIDTRRFSPVPDLASGRRPPTVAFAGKLAANKGIDDLLAACLGLAAEVPGLKLRAIGRGDPGVAERLAARAGVAGRPELLDLVGFLDRDALAGELAAADVFAAPSHYEGGPGFVYLEAMAAGLPVVACSGSGAAEVIRDGVTGILVPPGDVAALAAALGRLLGAPAERARLGAAARAWAVEHADCRRLAAGFEALYEGTIERVRAAAGSRR